MPLTKVASSMLASGASGSGGSTGKNYISTYNNNTCNGDFETGSDTGWNLCTVSSITNGLPSGLTLAAGTVTKTVISSGQIAGVYSLQTVFPTTANQGLITDAFTIDTEDQAKVLTFKFYYQVTANASSGNFSGTSSNTFLVAVYAVNGTNAGWMQPAGVYSMTQSSGAGIATGTFQTYSDTTQYRFAVLCVNAPSLALTVVFDDFQVGPQTAPIGPVVTDVISYTPVVTTTSGTMTNYNAYGKYRRVGDSIEAEVTISFTGAAGTWTQPLITLPSGLVADTSKFSVDDGDRTVGTISVLDAGTTLYELGTIGYSTGANKLVLAYTPAVNAASASATEPIKAIAISNLYPFTFFTNDKIFVTYKLPIQGWSSNVQMSNDTDTRVVAMSAQGVGGAVTANVTNIPTTSTFLDTHGAWTGSTYVVPVAGNYQVFGGASGPSNTSIIAYVNGSGNIGVKVANGTNANGTLSGLLTNLKAGDVVSFRADVSQTLTYFLVSMSRVSGPSVIAATETVALKRTSVSAAQINSSVTTYVDFPTADIDTHNAWVPSSGAYNPATGTWATQNPVYRVPVSGIYSVSATVGFQNAIMAGTYSALTLIKNGIGFADGSAAPTTSSIQYATSGSGLVRCVAGDLIGVNIFQDSGSAKNLQNYGAPRTQISIVRVGN